MSKLIESSNSPDRSQVPPDRLLEYARAAGASMLAEDLAGGITPLVCCGSGPYSDDAWSFADALAHMARIASLPVETLTEHELGELGARALLGAIASSYIRAAHIACEEEEARAEEHERAKLAELDATIKNGGAS
jgi:hypothetical protein